MPPLEINQSPHTSASVRLDESAAEQVNQYAAFIYTFAADVVGKKLVCSLRERPRLMNTLEAPQVKQVASRLRIRKGANRYWKGAAEPPAKRLASGVELLKFVPVAGMHSPFSFAVKQARCFAPEVMWTRHPQVGNCGAPYGASMFTQVNFRCFNKIRLLWVTAISNDDVCLRQSAANRRSRKRVEEQDLAVKPAILMQEESDAAPATRRFPK
jgi:hypothetical protein